MGDAEGLDNGPLGRNVQVRSSALRAGRRQPWNPPLQILIDWASSFCTATGAGMPDVLHGRHQAGRQNQSRTRETQEMNRHGLQQVRNVSGYLSTYSIKYRTPKDYPSIHPSAYQSSAGLPCLVIAVK